MKGVMKPRSLIVLLLSRLLPSFCFLALPQSNPLRSPTRIHANPSSTLSFFSPSKINLFLRILSKRPDGFHELASLFQTLDFGDTLHLTPHDKPMDLLECSTKGVPTDGSNLVLRALKLMREKTGSRRHFHVILEKNVPAQAGLGGGSGNAATAMWAANSLLEDPAPLHQLVEWSAEIGSDVSFFLSRGTAYCTGRGEILAEGSALPAARLLILKPKIGLSTPAVFRALDLEGCSKVDPAELRDEFLREGAAGVDPDRFVNDLEDPAFTVLPELGELKDEFARVAKSKRVMMSGSGTSLFCILEEGQGLDDVRKVFGKRDNLTLVETKFLNREEGVWFQAPQP